MLQDFRFAARVLRHNPVFAASAILTVALGVGFNGAAVVLARAVLWRPLPFEDPERLVYLSRQRPQSSSETLRFDGPQSAGAFTDWRTYSRSFTDLAAVQLWRFDLAPRFDLITSDRAERLRGALATPNLFPLLGVHAALGRTFSEHDGPEALAQSAVLSDGAWRRLFGGDPGVLGRTITVLAGRPRVSRTLVIVGVLSPDFRYTYPEDTEMWVPLQWDAIRADPRAALKYQVLARLRAAVTPALAAEDLHAVDSRVAGSIPSERFRLQDVPCVVPVQEVLTRSARPLLRILVGVAVFVLTIACVNLLHLLMSRVVVRQREIAIRRAVGAGPWRLVRQLLAESAAIAFAGTCVSVVTLASALPALRSYVPALLPRGDEVRVDAVVVLSATGCMCLMAVLATAGQFLAGRAYELSESLRHDSTSARAARWRDALTAAQVAAVLVLISVAGLLLNSFWRIARVDLGFDGRDVLTMEMRVQHDRSPDAATDAARLSRFQELLEERVRTIPGVMDSAITSAVPMRGTDWLRRLSAAPLSPGGLRFFTANERQVTPEYFHVMRIPLISGRLFTREDDGSAPRRAIVSQALARIMAPDGADVIGRRLLLDPSVEIVGVVGDVRTRSIIEAPPPAYYLPRAQAPSELLCLVVRASPGHRESVTSAVIRAVHEIDPMQPVERVTTLDQVASATVADRRFYAVITTLFAITGLALALVGLAGATARGVTERVRELAIRLALGAAPDALRWRITVRALTPALVGTVVGVIVCTWTTRLLTSQLFGVAPHDPLTLGIALGVVLLTTIAAASIAARHVLHVDAAVALRAE